MQKNRSIFPPSCIAVTAALALAGCTSVKTTTTARTATEQLLLSTASDHALSDTGLEMLSGKKVFVDGSYFDSYDSKYVMGSVRDALSRAGALMADTAASSDVVLEARSGAFAIDEADTMFGVPAFTLPLPLSGPIQTPEIAFYKAQKQRSYAKFALLAYNHQNTAHVLSTGPLDGRSFDSHFRVLFISWHRTDVPEKQLTRELERQRQTWHPQLDMTNLQSASLSSTNSTTTNAPAK